MKKVLFLTLLLFLSTLGYASLKTHKHQSHKIKVAVIDTGLDLKDPRFKDHLCPTGHKNFVPNKPLKDTQDRDLTPNESLEDTNGHGTHVAGLIQQFAGNADYCLLVYKYYSEDASGKENLDREVLALQEAMVNGAEVVNFSGGGPQPEEEELAVIRNHPKVTFVVAAGNEHENLDLLENRFYPASYWLKNMTVVSANGKDGKRLPSSNWSKKAASELGEDVISHLPDGEEGTMSGSSQATATFSGKLVDKLSKMYQD